MRYFVLAIALGFSSAAEAALQIEAATLPDARSVSIGSPATYFASIVNSGEETATNCSISRAGTDGSPTTVSYQTTDSGNALTGTPDTPATIEAGATQNFVVSVTPSSAWDGPVALTFTCDNATALGRPGVNDVYLNASTGSPPDLITILATPSADGVLRIASTDAAAAAGGAVINIGSGGGSTDVTATPRLIGFEDSLGIEVTICETNPSTGTCLAPRAASVDMSVGSTASTFSVFARSGSNAGIPFYPDVLRLTVEFTDRAASADAPGGILATGGPVRGRSSAAITSPMAPLDENVVALGVYSVQFRDEINDPNGNFIVRGTLAIGDDGIGYGTFRRNDRFPEITQVIRVDGTHTPNSSGGGSFSGRFRFLDDAATRTHGEIAGDLTFNYDAYRGFRGVFSADPASDEPIDFVNPHTTRMRITGVSSIPAIDCPLLEMISVGQNVPVNLYFGEPPTQGQAPNSTMNFSRNTPGMSSGTYSGGGSNFSSPPEGQVGVELSITQRTVVTGGFFAESPIPFAEPFRSTIRVPVGDETFEAQGRIVACSRDEVTIVYTDDIGYSLTLHIRRAN